MCDRVDAQCCRDLAYVARVGEFVVPVSWELALPAACDAGLERRVDSCRERKGVWWEGGRSEPALNAATSNSNGVDTAPGHSHLSPTPCLLNML